MTRAQRDFVEGLRQHRARRGVTIESVANATKIKRSLLVEFERGDLSRWPAGIFRRAFLREYAAAIGASPAETVAECLRLFPEGTPAAADLQAAEQPAPVELRLTLAPGGLRWFDVMRLVAAVVDTAAVAAIAAAAAPLLGVSFWTVAAVVAAVYYGSATAVLGKSLASWYVARRVPVVSVRHAVRLGGLNDANRVRAAAETTDFTFG